jgi:hypothetical protein
VDSAEPSKNDSRRRQLWAAFRPISTSVIAPVESFHGDGADKRVVDGNLDLDNERRVSKFLDVICRRRTDFQTRPIVHVVASTVDLEFLRP